MDTSKVTWRILLISMFLSAPISIRAQGASNPALYAEVRGIDDEAHREALRLTNLDIEVELRGSVAVTTLQATFAGRERETLEGHFALTLPSGSVTTGYALNIDDTMIDGVLGPKEQLREAYESSVRKKIDPGFAEVSSADVFSTKLYPIEEKGRTIRIRFATPVLDGYLLPLNVTQPVESISITLRTSGADNLPIIQLPSGMSAKWQKESDGLVASAKLTGQPIAGVLQLTRALAAKHVEINRRSSGERFFQITDAANESQLPNPSRVRIYWDTSTSRRDDLLDREIELAQEYVNRFRAPIDLILFSSGGAHRHEITSAQDLKTQLMDVTYRGASSVDVLSSLKLPPADRCLLFSDGQITLGRRDSFQPKCTISTIASATDANHAWLARVSRIGGGRSINLLDRSNADALHQLSTDRLTITRATDVRGRALAFSVVQQTQNGWLAVGEAPRSGAITLHIRKGDGSETTQEYEPPGSEQAFDGAASLWARDRVLEMSLQNPWSTELTKLSRYYGIPNDQLAFVVLESPDDYVSANLEPPANYPEEALARYRERKADHDNEILEAHKEHLDELRDEWKELKTWWSEQRKPSKKDKITEAATTSSRPTAGSGSFRSSLNGGGGGGGANDIDLSEIVVTGSLIQPSISIHMDPWQPTRPYLTALDIAGERRLDLVLAEQEQQHGSLPGFYLDVAEWMHRHGHEDQAAEVTLSALDTRLANTQTLSVVANRLLRYGDIDRAIDLYERLHTQMMHLPQPKLQLAIALAKRAASNQSKRRLDDLERALSLLNTVATQVWPEQYKGIDVIALVEANAIIPRYLALGGRHLPIDAEFVAKLDMDIRVLIQWNTAATDLDLWVAEPSGEKASYQHTRTTTGGRISNDMTNGYGPEEYLLRYAPRGSYEIAVDVFSTDSINPNGPTVVTARLIRNFGRANQSEEFMDIELLPGVEDDVRVGRFEVR